MFKPSKIKRIKIDHRKTFDAITIAAILFGIFALLTLVYYQARPLKLADIKVPVATDKASYYPAQEIGGIFFGETHYEGDVQILREVFCKNYRGIIKASGNAELFRTQARPQKLEGETIRIGILPADVPIGSNCVIQFTNIYDIQTPFGVRHETVLYYTQNFTIVGKQERENRDEQDQQQNIQQQEQLQSNADSGDSSLVGGGDDNSTNNETTTNNTTNNYAVPPSNQEPAEPVQPPRSCGVNLLGVKLFC